MPTFFNKKEDVIDLKLTRHGRLMLSMGQFKPDSYSFFDGDIIYEAQFGGRTTVTGSFQRPEKQNLIAGRIKDTPRIKTQTVFGGVETEVGELIKLAKAGTIKFGYGDLVYNDEKHTLLDKEIYDLLSPILQKNVEKTLISAAPLGQSSVGGRHRPAWDVRSLKAPISASQQFYTGSAEQIVQIPQLELDHTIFTYFQTEGQDYFNGDFPPDEDEEPTTTPVELNPNSDLAPIDGRLATPVYSDGTYVTQRQNYIFLDVVERNVEFTRENFDIEVFKVEINPDGTEAVFPLSFFKQTDHMNNETPENVLNENFPIIDDSYVEYYFDIEVDKGIDNEILCDVNLRDEKREYFVDYQLEYTCPDDLAVKTYVKSVVDPEEPC